MSDDANIQIGLALEVDEKSFAQGDKALEKVVKDAALNKAAKAAALYAKKTGDLASAQKLLAAALKKRGNVSEAESKATIKAVAREVTALERVEKAQRNAAKAAEDRAKRTASASEKSAARAAAAQTAGGRFDKTRKNVELAGDFETQARTIGGAAEFAGLGGAGQVGNIAGEIGAVTEALPLLKASVAGLPAAALSAAQTLGPAGVALAGVAVGFALGAKQFSKGAKEIQEALQKALDVQLDVAEQTATQTSADINQQIALNNRLNESRQTVNQQLDSNIAKGNQAVDNLGTLDGVLFSLGETVLESPVETLEKNQETLNETIKTTTDETTAYTEALTSQIVAANDARAALLNEATAARDQVALEQEITALTKEQAQDRLDAVANQKAAVQAEIDVLQKSGDTSFEVTERIAELEKELSGLGNESGLLEKQIQSTAASSEEAAKKQEELAKAQEQAADRIEKIQQGLATKLEAIGINTERSLADAAKKGAAARVKLNDDFAKSENAALTKALESRSKMVASARQADVKAASKLQNDLAKIRDKGDDDVLKAIEQRDFLAFAKAKATTQDETQEAINNAEVERAQRAADLQLALAEQQTEYQQERIAAKQAFDDRKADLRQALTDQNAAIRQNAARQREDAQRAAQRQIAEAQAALDKKLQLEQAYWQQSIALIPGGAGPSNNTRNSTQNNTFNQQFARGENAGNAVNTILQVLQAGA